MIAPETIPAEVWALAEEASSRLYKTDCWNKALVRKVVVEAILADRAQRPAATGDRELPAGILDFEPYLADEGFGKERSIRWIVQWFYRHHLPREKADETTERYFAALTEPLVSHGTADRDTQADLPVTDDIHRELPAGVDVRMLGIEPLFNYEPDSTYVLKAKGSAILALLTRPDEERIQNAGASSLGSACHGECGGQGDVAQHKGVASPAPDEERIRREAAEERQALLDLAEWVEQDCGAELPHQSIEQAVARARQRAQENAGGGS